MKNRLLPLLYLALVLPLTAMAAIYQTQDADGNIVFTDTPPSENAEELELPDLNILETESSRPASAKAASHKKSAEKRSYDKLLIDTPTNDSVIRANNGEISVSVVVAPPLARQDTLHIELDGTQINDGKSANVTLDGLDRGTHTLSAYIRTQSGQVAISANQVIFHLKRHSALN